MDLDKNRQQQLQEALLSAFPNEADLAQLVSFRMGEKLATIAGQGNLKHVTFKLIEWVVSHGRANDLILAAYQTNTGNPALRSLVIELGLIPVESDEFNYTLELI